MGTNMVSGAGLAVVLETGSRSYFGALAQQVTATDRAPTAFQTGVNRVSWLLINGFTKGDWLEAFLFVHRQDRPEEPAGCGGAGARRNPPSTQHRRQLPQVR
jgi:hypothetical protein